MKNLKLIPLILIGLAFNLSAIAQSTHVNAHKERKNNYVVSTAKVTQLKPIIMAAADLAEEDGDNFGNFEVVIYGETVKELKNKSKMKDYVEEANKANAKLKVCKLALVHYGVSPNDIPGEFQLVENAFTYLLQLQKSGYLSIEL